jgi:hypothetical protein
MSWGRNHQVRNHQDTKNTKGHEAPPYVIGEGDCSTHHSLPITHHLELGVTR